MVAMLATGIVSAQSSDKDLKKDLKSKITKECRKSAKQLEKDGWEVMPGMLLLERQIRDSRYAQLDKDEEGKDLNFVATHESQGGNYSMAKKIASSRALVDLAGQISTQVASVVENNTSNMNFGDGDLEFVGNCISSSKQKISAKLSGAKAVLDIFRINEDGMYEVRVMYVINASQSLNIAREIYRAELAKRSATLAGKVDEILK